jgi:solute carrier family 25 folate transporter 32
MSTSNRIKTLLTNCCHLTVRSIAITQLTVPSFSSRVASTVTYPFQVMKSRMQQPSTSIELTGTGDVRVVERDYTGMAATVRKIYQQEGVPGFFKGAVPNAVRVAPNAAVTFVVYEAVMDALQ